MAQSWVLRVPRVQLIRGLARTKTTTDLSAGQGKLLPAVSSTKGRPRQWQLIQDVIYANGLGNAHMMIGRRLLTLPGFSRPTKLWDLLVINKRRLAAALELKSLVGPSFGNNFNNRTEEAIGTAIDLWTAYREGAFGKGAPRPFIGWPMLVEDAPESRSAVRDTSPHFEVFPEFYGASYLDRYNVLCCKRIKERLYTTATVLASPRTAAHSGAHADLSELTSLKNSATSFAGHIATEAART